MRHTYANPNEEWDGFRPTAYTLSPEVWELPLERIDGNSDRSVPTTVGETLKNFEGQTVEVQHFLVTKVTSQSGEVTLKGNPFNREMLEELLRLQNKGVSAFHATWFWYDSDHVTDDSHQSYSFFVVHDGQIVAERVSFHDYSDNGFNPSLFEMESDRNPIWSDDPHWSEADLRWWYRKFYAETRTGQLMVLRPDEPKLHHYLEGRLGLGSEARLDVRFGILETRLAKINAVLWLLVIIGCFAIWLLWK